MIAIDTNILVRLLIKDPSEQAQIDQAKALLQEVEQIYIPQIVQVELVWVLESAYNFKKSDVLLALNHINNQPNFHLQSPLLFQLALEKFSQNNVDFSDCLIWAESQQQSCTLATFDRKLGQLVGTKWLKITKGD
ncbi:hypothetical protein TI05_07025 [Achromatium sp. WMS3]|nr:hypothetical protein TI05_07025 [Achromatium sp. WMS3]